jgi:RND superfamily putative drug exporter
MRGLRKQTVKEHPLTKATYVSQTGPLAGQVTRLDVVSRHDPFSPAAAALLTRIETELLAMSEKPDSPWFGASFDFIGPTSGTRDLKAVTESDQKLIQRLVVLAVYAILLVMLRRPLVCGYLILSVLFSYLVTIGATELVFAWLYPGFDGLDWKVPLFLFVILIAVGEDYNIYLVTRVFEEQRRLGLVEGLRTAVVRTGGIITSCGVIMAGTFISMMTGTLRGMLELGFALSLGVLLDTFIVRPVLVPAFLALLYRRHDAGPSEPDASAQEDASAAVVNA